MSKRRAAAKRGAETKAVQRYIAERINNDLALTSAILSDLKGASKMLSQAMGRINMGHKLHESLYELDGMLDCVIQDIEEGR